MKVIHGFVIFLCLAQIQCRSSLEKEIQGVYFHYYTGNSTRVFGELHLLEDSLYTHDFFMFTQSGSYQVKDDSLFLILDNLERIAYKISKIDEETWVLQSGFDSLVYKKCSHDDYRSKQFARIDLYSLTNIHTGIFLDTLDTRHSLIHYYKKADSTKIRLNDAVKEFEDISIFLGPSHSMLRYPVYCMIGEGISVADLYRLYGELAWWNYKKTTLILAKSGKNRFEIFEDNFGYVIGSDWYAMNIDTAQLNRKPALSLRLTSISDIPGSTFWIKDSRYIVQIDPQATLNSYIRIKEKLSRIAREEGVKFQFIVAEIDWPAHSNEMKRAPGRERLRWESFP